MRILVDNYGYSVFDEKGEIIKSVDFKESPDAITYLIKGIREGVLKIDRFIRWTTCDNRWLHLDL